MLQPRPREERRLHGKQQAALRVLVGGGSITEAAKEAGVRRATVSGWVNAANGDTTFRDELARCQGDLRKAVRSRLECSAGEAIDVLRELLHDPQGRTRLQAAKVLLGLVSDMTERPARRPPGGLRSPDEMRYTGEAERINLDAFAALPPSDREAMRVLANRLVLRLAASSTPEKVATRQEFVSPEAEAS